MSLRSCHHLLILLNSKKGIKCFSNLFTFSAFPCYSLFSFTLSFFVLVRFITCLHCCRLYRAYQKLFASMHDEGIGPHKTQFRRDENYGNKYYGSKLIVFGFLSKMDVCTVHHHFTVCHFGTKMIYGYGNGRMHFAIGFCKPCSAGCIPYFWHYVC